MSVILKTIFKADCEHVCSVCQRIWDLTFQLIEGDHSGWAKFFGFCRMRPAPQRRSKGAERVHVSPSAKVGGAKIGSRMTFLLLLVTCFSIGKQNP